MGKFVTPLLIIVLIIVAVYLGKVIYDKSFSSPKGQPKATQTITPSPTQNISSQPPWLSNLSDLERSFFKIPDTNASTSEKETFSELLRKNAKTSSDGIYITKDCQPLIKNIPPAHKTTGVAKNNWMKGFKR